METSQMDGALVVPEENEEIPVAVPDVGGVDLPVVDGGGEFEGVVDVGIPEDVSSESDPVEVPSAGDDLIEGMEDQSEEETMEETEDVEEMEETKEPVSPLPPVLEGPLPVYLVDSPEEDVESEIEAYSVSGSPYPGTISTTYLDYFAGIAQKLKFSEHYMAFRASQYEYYMVWGEGLEYDGARFRGSALSYCRIYTGSGSNNMSVTFDKDTFYLTPGTGFVYSDLEHFSSLTEGGTHLESLTLLFAVGFAVVYSVCHDLFDYVMQHIYRK